MVNLNVIPRINLRRGAVFGFLIVGALLAFEMFNYSTTEYSLNDLLGGLEFVGIRWATILAIAFCTIDFAGLARLFTPEQGDDEPIEVWYLFGAWILAAIMNAILTWWGVSVAVSNHVPTTNVFISHEKILLIVPVFVAFMVFLIRVLIIGTFTIAGERLFSQATKSNRLRISNQKKNLFAQPAGLRSQTRFSHENAKPAYRPSPKPVQDNYVRPEPSYHPLSVAGRGAPKERDF